MVSFLNANFRSIVMKKLIPVYALLTTLLVVFVLELRETRAMRSELQLELRQLSQRRPFPPGAGIPVFVTNEPLQIKNER